MVCRLCMKKHTLYVAKSEVHNAMILEGTSAIYHAFKAREKYILTVAILAAKHG